MDSDEAWRKILKFMGGLAAFSAVAVVGVFGIYIVAAEGFVHQLSALAICAFFYVLFAAGGNFSRDPVSKYQLVVFLINALLISYAFLLLPTPEAIAKLNEFDINQNLWEDLRDWLQG